MPEGYYVTPEQARRLDQVLNWIENCGKHLDRPWYRCTPRQMVDRRCTAKLKGALSSSDPTATVDNVKVIIGANPTSGSTVELTVYNTHDWDADDNADCRFEYHNEEDRWELYQVDCPSS